MQDKELSQKELNKAKKKALNANNPFIMLKTNETDAQYLKDKYKKIYNLDLDKKNNEWYI